MLVVADLFGLENLRLSVRAEEVLLFWDRVSLCLVVFCFVSISRSQVVGWKVFLLGLLVMAPRL